MSVSNVLEIAKTALIAQQKAVEVTSHNISNVNTPGYSRQTPVTEAVAPVEVSLGQLGGGVNVTEVKTAYDKFINMRIHKELSTLLGLEVKRDYTGAIEAIFNETRDAGLNDIFSQFWGAWEDLANNPGGTSERAALVQRGNLLTETFNTIYQDLEQFRQDIDIRVDAAIKDVNELAGQIAQLNVKILEFGAGGNPANDLTDQRNLLVEELSRFVDLNYFEDESGMLTILVGGGNPLVEGKIYNGLEMNFDGSGNLVINWVGSESSKLDITNYIQGGKLGGWLTVRDELIPGYETDLNALAEAVIKEVNRQHSQGVGLEAFSSVTGTYAVEDPTKALKTLDLPFGNEIAEGQSFTIWVYDGSGNAAQNDITIDSGSSLNNLIDYINTPSKVDNVTASKVDGKLKLEADSGYSFAFSNDSSNILMALGINTFFTGKDASDLGINPTVSGYPLNIAAARIGSDGGFAEGDNRNALDIVDLRDTACTILDTNSTFGDFLSSLVGEIGIDARAASRNYTFREAFIKDLEETREGLQGVSLDEEMTNLIRYQHAYQAAAKLIQLADEMLETLLAVQ